MVASSVIGKARLLPTALLQERLSASEIASVPSAIPTADMCLAFILCLPQIVGLGFFSLIYTCGFMAEEFQDLLYRNKLFEILR